MAEITFLDANVFMYAAGLKPRDAVHAATMQNNDISLVISADKDFEYLDFVTRIDPLTYP